MDKETTNMHSEVQFQRNNEKSLEKLQREMKNWTTMKETIRTSFIRVLVVFDLSVCLSVCLSVSHRFHISVLSHNFKCLLVMQCLHRC